MATEIERKFLVKNDQWRQDVISETRIKQGYLAKQQLAVRVRIADDQAFLTLKGQQKGIERLEFEYPIPVIDAEQLLSLFALQALIDKTRYRIPQGQHCWELDVFYGENTGLVLAEIELNAVDEDFERPAWLGEEVSTDARYFNINLITNPYCSWS